MYDCTKQWHTYPFTLSRLPSHPTVGVLPLQLSRESNQGMYISSLLHQPFLVPLPDLLREVTGHRKGPYTRQVFSPGLPFSLRHSKHPSLRRKVFRSLRDWGRLWTVPDTRYLSGSCPHLERPRVVSCSREGPLRVTEGLTLFLVPVSARWVR